MSRTVAVVLPVLAVFAAAVFRTDGPSPDPLTAPTTEFSAARAQKTLEWLVDQGIPHPLGTRANVVVRSGIVAQFRSHGYETRVQRRFACNAYGECGHVENIIARSPRPQRGEAVALVAHYDSVGAGPGASDDLMGVAALLEIARTVKEEKLRNPVLFLITDGEEAGMLGAEAFVADREASSDVAAVVNIENRGTHGSSNLFETSSGNRWLVRLLSGALPHPQATSFFPAIYELLPNDTDVTVFRRAGKAAVNFAAIRGVNWYHTPMDDLAHASPRTLQHHGENALGALRALGNSDLAARSRSDAVYFDILGTRIVWWPVAWTPWIAAASLALLVFAARRQVPREMTFGVIATFTALALSALGGMGLSWIARLRSGGANWVAFPGTLIASMWLAGIASAFAAAALFRKRAETRSLLYGAAIVWHVAAFATAVTLPGVSYLFLLPAVALTAAALAGVGETFTTAVASTAAGVVVFPILLPLYDALGSRMVGAAAVLCGLLMTLIAPLLGRWSNAAAASIVAVGCAIGATMLPPYTAEKPRRISVAYVDDSAAPAARLVVPVLTPRLERAARFRGDASAMPPWTDKAWVTDVTREPLQRVQLVARREGERVFVRVRSSRRANRVSLLIHGNISDLTVNGAPLPSRPERFRSRLPAGWTSLAVTGGDGLSVELKGGGRLDLVASDLTYGVPAVAGAVVKARNDSPAVPVHDGDVTITRTRITLGAAASRPRAVR